MNTDVTALFEIEWSTILPFLVPVVLLNVLLIGVALYDWVKRKDLIATPYIWLMAILLVQSLGPILYLVIGRKVIRNDYSRKS
ncbi:PLDc N-terminal domain-containing protein [Planococcus sp. S3-L1]|uniref:PLDc N-terminal domain-containing protein n=1 Tax=Planococcus sp. S3-L1 TaxID=3046200 RepID=UPI0024BB7489|nr:PLDc N-terminal domain-containing protein [Planococcus sp. S3-L1]MDJ0332226.1 PLDc N-terminal domain-containing protein [Planococcus sp. S3-L1]